MDPISLAISGVGLGMQIFGGMGQAADAKKAAQISKDEATQEMGINNVKQQQMELEGRRMQMENIRNNQRARAMATNAATTQGAQFGSGLAGGLAQINDQTNYNMNGVSAALGFGRQISAYNNNISGDKMQMADVQADSAKNAGLASLGGSLMKSGGTLGNLFSTGASAAGSGIFGMANSGGMLFQ
jgi:hypothetical protein